MKVREVHFFERTEAAGRLESLKETVIQAWVEICVREIPAAQGYSRRVIINSLPKLLDRLVDTLRNSPVSEPGQMTKKVSCEHGEERADLEDYSLDEMLHEYELLREVLFSALEVEAKLDFETREILETFMMRSVREAVVRFAEREREKLSAERKRSEQANQDLREFFTQAPLPMVIMEGPTHRFALTNPSYEELIGRKAVGMTVAEVFSGPVAENFLPLLDEVYRTGKAFIGKEVPLDLPGPDGQIRRRWVDFGYHPFRDPNGGIRGVLAVAQDQTAQVEARRELEERTRALKSEQHKLEAVFRESPAAMALWRGPEMIFEMVNPEYQSIFPDRQLVGLPLLEAAPELRGQNFDELIRRVLETGEPYRGQEIPARIDRDENGNLEDRYYDFVYVRVDDSEGNPYGVYDHAVDVTEKVRNRKKLEESREKLLSSIRDLETERDLRERFVAALTHDLRTPMTAAKMNAQFLLRRSPGPEALRIGLLRILGALKRTDQMITDLLDTNRIKAGQGIQIVRTRADLAAWLRSVADDLVIAYGDRFRLEIDSVADADFDPSAIQRIVENLAGNAVKYGDRERPIRIAASQSDTHFRIAVHNEGTPIPPHDLVNLFQPFRRTVSALEGGQKGWGIGLTLVKGLAEAHGGTVGASSSEELGTTFYVDVPRFAAESEAR